MVDQKRIKNNLRSFQPQNNQKFKNSPGCPKNPRSYKEKYHVCLDHKSKDIKAGSHALTNLSFNNV